VPQRLTDLPQTYPEALAQPPAAAGPACRPSPLPSAAIAYLACALQARDGGCGGSQACTSA
jgi:hypothetical protein